MRKELREKRWRGIVEREIERRKEKGRKEEKV